MLNKFDNLLRFRIRSPFKSYSSGSGEDVGALKVVKFSTLVSSVS